MGRIIGPGVTFLTSISTFPSSCPPSSLTIKTNVSLPTNGLLGVYFVITLLLSILSISDNEPFWGGVLIINVKLSPSTSLASKVIGISSPSSVSVDRSKAIGGSAIDLDVCPAISQTDNNSKRHTLFMGLTKYPPRHPLDCSS